MVKRLFVIALLVGLTILPSLAQITITPPNVGNTTLLFTPDATFSIGAASTNRPNNIFTASYIFPGSPGVAFAALGTPAAGAMIYCTDCTVTTAATCPATSASCVCTASGTGALAVRLNSVWDCTVHH